VSDVVGLVVEGAKVLSGVDHPSMTAVAAARERELPIRER